MLYAEYIFSGYTPGLVVVKVAVYMLVLIKEVLYLGDVVYGVEDDIVCGMTDANGGIVLFEESEIGKVVHESLKHATEECRVVGSGCDT